MRPPFGSRANAVRALSMSAALRTPAAVTVIPNKVAAASAECRNATLAVTFGVHDDRSATHLRRNLLEDLQPFSADGGFKILKPGDVSIRTRQARNKTTGDRVG